MNIIIRLNAESDTEMVVREMTFQKNTSVVFYTCQLSFKLPAIWGELLKRFLCPFGVYYVPVIVRMRMNNRNV